MAVLTATGLTALSLAGGLVLTALLLYYAGSDTLRSASSVAHQLLGVAAVAAVWIHLTRPERRRDVPVLEDAPGRRPVLAARPR